jgi:hypothetical protein
MPGFLSKLFRRKNSAETATAEPKQPRTQRRGRSARKEAKKQVASKEIVRKGSAAVALGPKDEEDGLSRRTPSFSATTTSGRESSVVSREQSFINAGSTKKLSTKVLSPRNKTSPRPRTSPAPVDLDDTDFEGSDHDENRDRSNLDNGLSFHQLQQFNMQQHTPTNQQQEQQQLYVMSDKRPATNHKNGARMPDGMAMDDMAAYSESSQSEFNLSTDGEDEEYNTMKKKVAPHTASTTSAGLDASGVSSQNNSNTDEEHAIFPDLHTDEEGENSHHDTAAMLDDEPGRINIVSMAASETYDDMRAWGLSPSTGSSGKENGRSPPYAVASKKSPHGEKTASRRVFTTPAPASNDDFANFANFGGNFDATFDTAFPESAMPTAHTPSSHRSSSRSHMDGGDPGHSHPSSSGGSSRRIHSSSASAAAGDSSLTDLLAQAKMVGRSRRDHKSPSSVNSAPAVTAQYLRQYHGLGTRSASETKSAADQTTSVSDIIQSLEDTNTARLRSTSSRSRSNRSVGSRDSGANTSVRSAKERIRERRRQEREGSSSSVRKSRSKSSQLGSDDSEDNDPSENWLFDEVAGALGPRGVAADMESLSGRSNRSRNSAGGKSHKSHRSHRSSRRGPKSTSNESVDSRGSKNSRNSRYSHKSTRSYLSQMSEQSRSVANDLLRLEMQLAMVGSQENGEDGHGRSGGTGSVGGSVGGNSRTSRTSRNSSATANRRSSAITKRSKITVIAPPGKLGIILANKADSKGTVVSGVRTSSVLAEKISPGDRIIAIDGEDVSRMTVSEITTIMARKSEFERTLTVLTTPKHMTRSSDSYGGSSSGGIGGSSNSGMEPDGSYSSYRR